jgi:YbbR domain-containing protein
VQGKKNNLLNRKINTINMELDAKKINLKKGKNKIELSPEYFQSYIPDNLQIVNIKPNKLEIVIDEKISKTLKIIPELNGEPQEKYKITNVKVNPDKIKVSGPKTQLSEINEIKTLPVKINDISNSVITQANLDLNKNFHTETDNVSIEIILNEKTLEKKIENIKVNFKNSDSLNNYEIIPDSISIVVKGKYSNLNNLDKSKLIAHIELKTGITKFKPIINLPNGIEQISMSPSFVEIKKIK